MEKLQENSKKNEQTFEENHQNSDTFPWSSSMTFRWRSPFQEGQKIVVSIICTHETGVDKKKKHLHIPLFVHHFPHKSTKNSHQQSSNYNFHSLPLWFASLYGMIVIPPPRRKQFPESAGLVPVNASSKVLLPEPIGPQINLSWRLRSFDWYSCIQ